jgi:hypothetical protein
VAHAAEQEPVMVGEFAQERTRGPPFVQLHQPGINHLQAVEEALDLGACAPGSRSQSLFLKDFFQITSHLGKARFLRVPEVGECRIATLGSRSMYRCMMS